MRRRQPLPRLWLMTDERQGEALWSALRKLPPGSGVVFRHYSLDKNARRALFERVRRIARKRRFLLVAAGRTLLPGADGRHGVGTGHGIVTMPVHDLREVRSAERAGAHLLFLSPVFATRSHPGQRHLGGARFGLITRQARVPVIALGGMDARRARTLTQMGAYGWAAIDAWSR